MKATCEIVVEREMLLAALTANDGVLTLLGPDDLEICPGEAGIAFRTASVDCELEAAGAWDHLIITQRGMIVDLLERTSNPTVKLLFVGIRLFVDRLPVPAETLDSVDGFNSQRARRTHTRTAYQRELRLSEPAGIRLRSSRRQASPSGLPLFETERPAL